MHHSSNTVYCLLRCWPYFAVNEVRECEPEELEGRLEECNGDPEVHGAWQLIYHHCPLHVGSFPVHNITENEMGTLGGTGFVARPINSILYVYIS